MGRPKDECFVIIWWFHVFKVARMIWTRWNKLLPFSELVVVRMDLYNNILYIYVYIQWKRILVILVGWAIAAAARIRREHLECAAEHRTARLSAWSVRLAVLRYFTMCASGFQLASWTWCSWHDLGCWWFIFIVVKSTDSEWIPDQRYCRDKCQWNIETKKHVFIYHEKHQTFVYPVWDLLSHLLHVTPPRSLT